MVVDLSTSLATTASHPNEYDRSAGCVVVGFKDLIPVVPTAFREEAVPMDDTEIDTILSEAGFDVTEIEGNKVTIEVSTLDINDFAEIAETFQRIYNARFGE